MNRSTIESTLKGTNYFVEKTNHIWFLCYQTHEALRPVKIRLSQFLSHVTPGSLANAQLLLGLATGNTTLLILSDGLVELRPVVRAVFNPAELEDHTTSEEA